jgi:hypothetical protein
MEEKSMRRVGSHPIISKLGMFGRDIGLVNKEEHLRGYSK